MVRQLSVLLAGEVGCGQAFQRHAELSGFGHPAAEPLARGDPQVYRVSSCALAAGRI
jgi:hypothetical protein